MSDQQSTMITTPVVAGAVALPAAVIEPARLLAVAGTGLLDTDAEDKFDDLVLLAREVAEAQYGFFTVVDAHRSFWKSAVGLPSGGVREVGAEDSLCQVMIDVGVPLVVDDAQNDERVRDLGAVRNLPVGASMTYPVRDSDGHIIGGLSVCSAEPRSWTDEERRALATLARGVSAEVQLRGALAVLQAEADGLKLARDSYAALARSLQQGLLPPALPAIAGLGVAASYLPAGSGTEVVGDFYDLFEVGRDVWVVIGDVCGHGVEAAKLTALARYTVRSQATEPAATPATVLSRLNDAMLIQHVDRYLTAAVARIRPSASGWVGMMSSAGHEPPLILRKNGTVEAPAAHGRILGVPGDLALSDTPFTLDPGDGLVLVTDGVTEARAGRGEELFGDDRLAEILVTRGRGRDAAGTVAEVMTAVAEHARGYHADDTAVLVLRSVDVARPHA
jgi:serine phosphatase RsbU (regulator of sigma subunit)